MDAGVTTAINAGVAGLVDSVVGLVVTNLPLILTVVVAFIGIGLAKRFIRTAAS